MVRNSVRSFFDTLARIRRQWPLDAGARRGTEVGRARKECFTEPGMVVHKPSGKKLSYGALASHRRKAAGAEKEELQLKARSDWRYTSASQGRLTT